MSKENRRLYDRKLIHAYLCTQRPDELERFIGGLIGKLKDKLPGPFKKKAADYICLAFRDLCNPDRDPILLDPERDLRGLFLKHAYRLYIKDSIKLSRERQRFDVENPEQCATLPGRGLTSSLDYGAGQPFPERRWAKLDGIIETLAPVDQELLRKALECDCFRAGSRRVQFDNQKLARLLGRPVEEVARSIERIKGLVENLMKPDEEDPDE